MNLALRDVHHRLGRFLLTALGLGLLLATVMAMGGIYRGMVVEALSIVQGTGAALWVVQKDTNGPFAEASRVPDDLYRTVRAIRGVRDASPLVLQPLELRVGERNVRVQLLGHRPDGMGAPVAVVAGRPALHGRYELVLGREAGVPIGTRLRIGRADYTVVGMTQGVVSNGGDPVAFVSVRDAQEIQFLKSAEAIRNDRVRAESSLAGDPALSGAAAALATRAPSTNVANAVLVALWPWADPAGVAKRIERWTHHRAMTAAEQERVLAESVIERGRKQTLLFRVILLLVTIVIIALILYTMTLEKTRDIATLKIIGAPDRKIAGLILQEALALGLIGYALGGALISQTHAYFPRRVVLIAFDQWVLLAIVVVICVAASLVGIVKALHVDAATALGGGA